MANGDSNNQVIFRLQVEQADITALRDAYAKMQTISPTDNRSWVYWAGYHGFPNYYCWHHGRTGANGTQFAYNMHRADGTARPVAGAVKAYIAAGIP